MNLALIALAVAAAQPAEAAPETPAAAVPAQRLDCINTRDIRQSRQDERGYYVRTAKGWWKNSFSCPNLSSFRGIVWQSPVNRQCRGDIVTIADFRTRIDYGGCALGDWELLAGAPPVNKPGKKK
jgi:hypothetical protein